jgi:hypothetical protein
VLNFETASLKLAPKSGGDPNSNEGEAMQNVNSYMRSVRKQEKAFALGLGRIYVKNEVENGLEEHFFYIFLICHLSSLHFEKYYLCVQFLFESVHGSI